MGTRSSKKRKLDETDLIPSQVISAKTSKRKTLDNDGNIQEVTKLKYNVERVGQMIDYLVKQREAKHPVKEEPKPHVEKLKPLYKDISMEMQKFVVFLRYGSITEVRPK
jgi:hypothetical protein